jgi:hypothetical protein
MSCCRICLEVRRKTVEQERLYGVVSRWMKFEYRAFFCEEGPRSKCYGRTAALRLFVQTLWWRERLSVYLIFPSNGEPVEWTWRGETEPSATLSVTNPTWTDLGSNAGLRGERPTTTRLSHGTAWVWSISVMLFCLFTVGGVLNRTCSEYKPATLPVVPTF